MLLAGSAAAVDLDRLRVQRQEVFEFAEKPTVGRNGDMVTIRFAVREYCDATVAIEDENGKIVRHLASGVLGDNAPEPFQQKSLKQTIVWDGKDEVGRYVDGKDRCRVRVSLGLKARMERTSYWSPHKMAASGLGTYAQMQSAPEGVYVYFPGATEQLRLFDHDGNYVRTVYPFPRDKIERIQGLKYQPFPPDDERLPSKLLNHDQDTLLPQEGSQALAVQGDRICLAGEKILFLGTDGSSGGRNLEGPVVAYEAKGGDPGSETSFQPHRIAFSPDGKRIYLAGYTRRWTYNGHAQRTYLHGVNVVDLEGDLEMKPFAGLMKAEPEGVGAGDDRFTCPLGVACDMEGRVYVADNLNNRIQVFDPAGKLLKSIPAARPGMLQVDPTAGEIWVTSSDVIAGNQMAKLGVDHEKLRPVKPVLRVLGPFDDPREKALYELDVPIGDYYRYASVYDVVVEIDFHTTPPTVWTSVAPSARGDGHVRCAVRLWQPQEGKLVLKRDFSKQAGETLADPRPARFNRPRLWANPATGMAYLGLITPRTAVACKSFSQVIRLDPEQGTNRAEQMLTDAEDMGFDYHGYAYLRTFDSITRYDPSDWSEVPYDYGENRLVFHGQGGGGEKPFESDSACTLPSVIGGMFHMGGLGVAPDGTVVVSCINPASPLEKDRMREKGVRLDEQSSRYTPPLFPGRHLGWETHLFDKHGRLMQDDVVPGLGVSNFLELDRDHNVYVLAASTPYLDGKPYFNGRGCTLIKLKPGKMKALSPKATIPLSAETQPQRPLDMTRPGLWVEGAEWLFGPVGADGHYGSGGKCSCYVNGRFALDYYGRSFAPEVDRFRVVVLDTNGNVILRIGRYGNVDDGRPLIADGGPSAPRSIGGDEVAIMHCMNLAVHSDRRLLLADVGNDCIRSVKLDYHASETVPLRDVPDAAAKR
ncbi:MAG: hypothetical protein WD069_20840 [Planctomycetales bacterium]